MIKSLFAVALLMLGCQQGNVAKQEKPQECCFNQHEVIEIKGKSSRISRESAVKIHVSSMAGRVRGTGSYFTYKGSHIVITAAHLWMRIESRVMKSKAQITGSEDMVIGTLVYIDHDNDIAILEVPELGGRKPAKFNRAKSYAVGEKTTYSGFPGANNLLTFQGEIAGEGYGRDITMFSMAWGGSSGSGVFNEAGEYVGVVSSIMVGRGFAGPQLVGTVVYVAPANLIDLNALESALSAKEATKNDGF